MHTEDKPVRIIQCELDGKKVAYTDRTEFLVQVGRGSKGSFKTKYAIVGDLGRAVLYYKGVNVGNGYKKRLLAPSMNRPLLAVERSCD